MKGHVPHWLPDGFGLSGAWKSGGGVAAVWVDIEGRELTVFYLPQQFAPTPGPRVGPWTVTVDVPGRCANSVLGTARCLGYAASASDGYVAIQAMGLDRSVGDRIAQSIPL
jgi:hypothetical protein